jgi:hypothetical protein
MFSAPSITRRDTCSAYLLAPVHGRLGRRAMGDLFGGKSGKVLRNNPIVTDT